MTEAEIEINEAFEEFLSSTVTENVAYGGSGSGKTTAFLQIMILKGLQDRPKSFSLFVQQDVAGVRSDLYEPVKDILDGLGVKYMAKDSSPFEIILPNKHRLIFISAATSAGADAVERMKKYSNATRVMVNEATGLEEATYIMLLNRAGRSIGNNCQAYITFNPISDTSWIAPRWVVPYLEGKTIPDTIVKHSTFEDNAFLNPAWVERLRQEAENNPNYARVYLRGELGHAEGLVFEEGRHWMICTDEEWRKNVQSKPLAIGLDHGRHRIPAVGIFTDTLQSKIYARALFYLSDESVKGILDENDLTHNITTPKIISKFREVYDRNGWEHKSIVIYGDSANPEKNEEINAEFCCVNAYKPIEYGIDRMMSKAPIMIHEDSKLLIAQLRMYSWEERTDGKRIPVKSFEDFIDALRYGVVRPPASNAKTVRVRLKADYRQSRIKHI